MVLGLCRKEKSCYAGSGQTILSKSSNRAPVLSLPSELIHGVLDGHIEVEVVDKISDFEAFSVNR